MLTCKRRADGLTIQISGEMTIYTAAELAAQLVEAAAGADTLEVDLGAVPEIDSAGVQLLMALKVERERGGAETVLSNHSDGVLDVFETLGLTEYFQDPIVLTEKTEVRNGP